MSPGPNDPSGTRQLLTFLLLGAVLAATGLVVGVVVHQRQPTLRPAATPPPPPAAAAPANPTAAGTHAVRGDRRVRLVLADGRALTGADLAGRRAVIGFMQDGCGDCATGLQTLAALSADPTVRAVAVNVATPQDRDAAGAAKRLARFADALGAHGQVVFAADPDQQTSAALGVRELDTFVLVDRDGRELARGTGLTVGQLRRLLGRA
jgi:hypothetical protein